METGSGLATTKDTFIMPAGASFVMDGEGG